MNRSVIEKAAGQFIDPGNLLIESLGNGLIHHTYKVGKEAEKKAIVLQAINNSIFKRPEDILHNYDIVYQYLQINRSTIAIPAPMAARNGSLLWIDEENNYWRANAFIADSYSPLTAADEQSAHTVSASFARFTHSLEGLDMQELKPIIPHFHNLTLRYGQLEEAIDQAPLGRLMKSTHVIAELRQKKQLLRWYESISNAAAYPLRVMHHDCKISNILFDRETNVVICPVDLDTVMPGKFFSDLGDMIRSMSATVDENDTRWEDIGIRPSFYRSILEGYREGIGDSLRDEEQADIHYSGLVMIYMQATRFLADFLNGDIYYKTTHPEQNLNRALNQLILLERLEEFLKTQYSFAAY